MMTRSRSPVTIKHTRRGAFRLSIAALLLISLSCEGTSGPSFPPGPHMVVRFGYVGDSSGSFEFLARASRSELLDSVRAELALPVDQRQFVNGPIRRAAVGENLDWQWAFVFNGWHLTDASAEVCDATPEYLDDNLTDWLDSLGHYCPWSAYVRDTSWVP